jgi:lysozyme
VEAIETAKSIAKPFEGWSFVVYLCPAGYWTIAFGHRCSKDHPPVTLEQGENYLSNDMLTALKGAIKYCPVLLKYPKALGAITDFCFNLGVGRLQTSTLKRRINQEDWPEVINELMRWVYGRGKKLKGLVARRVVESTYMEPKQ